jgi:hypothetical protein
MVLVMEPKPPRMIREDETSLRLALVALVVVNAVLLAGLVGTAGVLAGMAGSERFSRAVAVRLHLAPERDLEATNRTAAGAAKGVAVTRQFVVDRLARLEERNSGDEVIELRAVVTDLQSRVDSLQDVGRIEDLAAQISAVQRRLEASCAWAREASRTREESVEASFRAYVARAC